MKLVISAKDKKEVTEEISGMDRMEIQKWCNMYMKIQGITSCNWRIEGEAELKELESKELGALFG